MSDEVKPSPVTPAPPPRGPVPLARHSPASRAPLRLVTAPVAPRASTTAPAPSISRSAPAYASPPPPLTDALPVPQWQPVVAGLAAVAGVAGTVLLFLKL